MDSTKPSQDLPSIVYTDAGREEDREAILQRLTEYNDGQGQPTTFGTLGLLLRSAAGETIGGLWGRSSYDWLFVDLLFVPESLRGTGLGSSLLRQAEQIAGERGCVGVWLDTFAFQALPFYQKQGYTIFGQLADRPRGSTQFWLQKRLSVPESR